MEDQIAEAVVKKLEDRNLLASAAKTSKLPKRLLKPSEAAAILGCTSRQVHNLIADKKLPVVRWGDEGRPYIDIHDLDRAIQQHKIDAA